MDYETIILETAEKMGNCVDHFANELRGVRSGQATPGLVDSVRA